VDQIFKGKDAFPNFGPGFLYFVYLYLQQKIFWRSILSRIFEISFREKWKNITAAVSNGSAGTDVTMSSVIKLA